MRNVFKIYTLFVLLILLSSCIKTQTKTHRDLLTRKGGEWKVDKFTVNWFSPNGEYASKTEVFENAGEISFQKDGENVTMSYNNSIPLDGNYSFGPFLDYKTNIVVSTLDGITYFDIVYLDKKKLRLFSPRLTNEFWSQFYDYSFYIECSKK